MKTVNEKIKEAVEDAVVSNGQGRRKFGNCLVEWDGRFARVSYCGNRVFEYDRKTDGWWLDNCGWPTRMTREKTEACMEALGLPYRYFVRKRCQWLRNLDTGREWKCGDGRITEADIDRAGLY